MDGYSCRMAGRGILELSERALRADDPGEALRALVALREEIAVVEVDAVERALSRGWSWTEVAGAIGISRQAAHKRYARRTQSRSAHSAEGSLHAPEPRSPHLDDEVRQLVRAAQMSALGLGHAGVHGAHLVLGLLVAGGEGARALQDIRIDYERASAAVERLSLPHATPDRQRIAEFINGRVAMAGAAEVGLRQAFREATRLGEDRVRGQHVLLALLRLREPTAVDTFTGMGFGEEVLDRLLSRLLLGWDPGGAGEPAGAVAPGAASVRA